MAFSLSKNVAPAVLPDEPVAADRLQEPEDAELPSGADGDGSVCVFDLNELLERLGGATEAVDRIISLFLVSVSGHIEALVQAVSEGDAQEIHFHAHTIVGIAANVGAPRIRSTAARMEALAKAGSLTRVPALLAELQESLLAFQSLFDPAVRDET